VLGSASLDFLAMPLNERGDLARALVSLGTLTFEPTVDPEALAGAVVLQDAIQRCCVAACSAEPMPRRDVETINSYASDEPPVPILRVDGAAVYGAIDPARAGLAALARDAIETVARHPRELRTCEGSGCGAFFLDLSRGKGRRWCSMARCGNRVKVAALRRRRRR
jgi:predicted RNA-binding Zn ribbon-like protein